MWLCERVGLRPDLHHARIAWIAKIAGIVPYIPAEAQAHLPLAEALASPYRRREDHIRDVYTVEDAQLIVDEVLRHQYMNELLQKRFDDDFEWLVNECGWSIAGVRVPALVFTKENRGDVALLELLRDKGAKWLSQYLAPNVASAGRVDVLEWIFEQVPDAWRPMAIGSAADEGQLEALRWFHQKFPDDAVSKIGISMLRATLRR